MHDDVDVDEENFAQIGNDDTLEQRLMAYWCKIDYCLVVADAVVQVRMKGMARH